MRPIPLAALALLGANAKVQTESQSLAKDNSLLDTRDIGAKFSLLSLNMLNKQKNGEPADEEMVQLAAHHKHRHRNQMLIQDDVKDILAFSSTNVQNEDEEPLAFTSGGAIMDALQEQDPGFKSASTELPKKLATEDDDVVVLQRLPTANGGKTLKKSGKQIKKLSSQLESINKKIKSEQTPLVLVDNDMQKAAKAEAA